MNFQITDSTIRDFDSGRFPFLRSLGINSPTITNFSDSLQIQDRNGQTNTVFLFKSSIGEITGALEMGVLRKNHHIIKEIDSDMIFYSNLQNDHPLLITKVYLFLNPIDALSYFQLYGLNKGSLIAALFPRFKLDHISSLLLQYPNATPVLCFPNTKLGRLLDVRTAMIFQKSKTQLFAKGDSILLSNDKKKKLYPIDKFTIHSWSEFENRKQKLSFKIRKPKERFKTFNDALQ